jgi:polyisoprenoid-binding protein YceI
MTIVGTSVTALDVTVDMASLRSDDERRDSQLASRGLETARFPTATFTLVEPLALSDVPAEGESIGATAVGDLTLHGVTQRVEVPVSAQWAGEHIEVAATLDMALGDHDIEPPTGFLVLSIADTGTVELHLMFRRG